MKNHIISNIKKSKSLREYLTKSKEKQFIKDYKNINKCYFKPNSQNDNSNKIIINSFSSKENSICDQPALIKNNIYFYNKGNSIHLDYTHNSFSSKINSKNDSLMEAYNNNYYNINLLEAIINRNKKKKEEENAKMKKNILKKVNAFLFAKKIEKNILNLDLNINEMKKAFSFSSNNNTINKEKRRNENLFYIKKNLFPKTQKDNKFRKIKYVGDLIRNNNFIFKKNLLKQKENTEKLLFEIRKAQSMEIKNLKLGLALLKTKHKVYKCDKLLKYKYS